MAGELSGLARDLRKLIDQPAVDDLRHVAGQAGKDAAADTSRRDLGADMAMSGFRNGRVKLSSGYDLTGPSDVVLGLRPAGAWVLADKGRRGVMGPMGPIKPKARSGRQALGTPWGPRASVRSSRSPGLNTVRDTERKVEVDAAVEVERALARRIAGF